MNIKKIWIYRLNIMESHCLFSSSFGFFVLEVSVTSQRDRLAVAAVLLLGYVCVKGLPKLEPYSAGLYSG